MTPEELDVIASVTVDAAYMIHTRLGPGLLESVYEVLLAKELTRRGILVERQQPITFEFDGTILDGGFIPDLILQRAIVVEIKATEKPNPVFERQVNTYLKILDYRLGLLLNFGMPLMKDGIKRIVNKF